MYAIARGDEGHKSSSRQKVGKSEGEFRKTI
jgi:hypothetical protein